MAFLFLCYPIEHCELWEVVLMFASIFLFVTLCLFSVCSRLCGEGPDKDVQEEQKSNYPIDQV